ncbi:hypothetical protein [Mycolicibacterium llatzerense]|uniref:hypothetical protein n=1 Tax=Mycolicibacterium llatzerense TaxID=280871 RepID=UPI0021B6613A|nr:hypothetical protein [Mycolicibacterium llatzerense]MCT7372928.1 hypothetical protein [Mycolicibacterium llatzerense]
MTDGPDWAETLAAVKKVPGKESKNNRLGMDQVAQWQEFQQQRTGADVAVAVGAVDTGDDFDGWGAVTEWAQDVGDGIGSAIGQVGTLANNLLTAAETVIGNIGHVIADGLGHGLQDIWDAIGSGLGGAISGNNASTLNALADKNAQDTQDALAASYAAQWALQQQANGGGSSGVTFEMDMAGADGDPLPSADWVSVSNMAIRVVGSVDSMGMSAGASVGTVAVANCAHLYSTDSQSLGVVLGPKGDSVAETILHFHSNTGFTTGLYLSIKTTGLVLGYYSGALGSRTYTPLSGGTVSKTLTSATRIEVRNAATANNYDVFINSSTAAIATVSDPGAHAVSGNRSTQVTMTSRTVPPFLFQGAYTAYSFWLSAVLVSDYIIPTYVGSTACVHRTSTSTVSLGSSGNNYVLGSSFFGVVDKATGDITVDLANSKFTVSQEGTYEIGIRSIIDMGSGTASAQAITPLLYVNGSIAKWGGESFRYRILGDNGAIYAGDMTAMYSTFRVYLNAGDYVQPGWNNRNVGGGTLTGEATGTKTYFDIVKIGSKT